LQEIRGFTVDDDRRRAIEIVATGGNVFAELVGRAARDYNLQPQLCQPGTTDITPRYWRHSRSLHILEVLSSGESALCHAVPRDHDMEPKPYTRIAQEILAQDLRTTHTIRLPEDVAIYPIIGPVAEDPRIRVHEVIMHSVEPMP
jgi:hypothetical protein